MCEVETATGGQYADIAYGRTEYDMQQALGHYLDGYSAGYLAAEREYQTHGTPYMDGLPEVEEAAGICRRDCPDFDAQGCVPQKCASSHYTDGDCWTCARKEAGR